MPSLIDKFGYDFEVMENGEGFRIYRSKGRFLDKISGSYIEECRAEIDTCGLCTEKTSREVNEETGKRSDTYLSILYDEPLYGADENDNGSEDRIEYPIGSGVVYRVTTVRRKGHALCEARAVKVPSQRECDVTEPDAEITETDIIGFGR